MWLNIYQRPNQGSGFLRRYRVYQYQMATAAVGGFDTASCVIAMPRSDAEDFFSKYDGARVAVFKDSVTPVWEGYINRVSFGGGNLSVFRSLDEMANRVSLVYSLPQSSTTPQELPYVDLTGSIARYGIKQGQIDAYVVEGTNIFRLQTLQNTKLAVMAHPQVGTQFSSQAGDTLLTVEMLGFWHTLTWQFERITDTSTEYDASDAVIAALSTLTTPYFDATDTSLIESNTSFDMPLANRTGISKWQFLQSIQEAGDGTQRWVMGITPTDLQGRRRFYYRPARSAFKYLLKMGSGRVKTLYGQTVEPWRVEPDCFVRVTDLLVGYHASGDDPRDFYVEMVNYAHDGMALQLVSADDPTVQGILRQRKFYNRTGRSFGAPVRQTWS